MQAGARRRVRGRCGAWALRVGALRRLSLASCGEWDAAGSSALRAWASRVWAAWLAQVLVGTKLCNGRVVRHVIPHHVIPYPSRDGDHVIHIP